MSFRCGRRRYYQIENGRRNIDRILLKTPVFGVLHQKIAVAKFTRTLGTLISSGVSIIEALNITARTDGNKVMEEAVHGSSAVFRKARPLPRP